MSIGFSQENKRQARRLRSLRFHLDYPIHSDLPKAHRKEIGDFHPFPSPRDLPDSFFFLQNSNHDQCDTCDDVGELLCCESCPRAFHPECLVPAMEEDEVPKGSWICPSCTVDCAPSYGDVIWAKLGYYRPWPGRIPLPQDLPEFFLARSHDADDIPVFFLGSQTYSWIKPAYVQPFVEKSLPKRRTQFK